MFHIETNTKDAGLSSSGISSLSVGFAIVVDVGLTGITGVDC